MFLATPLVCVDERSSSNYQEEADRITTKFNRYYVNAVSDTCSIGEPNTSDFSIFFLIYNRFLCVHCPLNPWNSKHEGSVENHEKYDMVNLVHFEAKHNLHMKNTYPPL